MPSPSITELIDRCQRHEIKLSEPQAELLAAYAGELWSWNEKMNLTRHVDLDSFVDRDVLDTYQLSLLLNEGDEVLDLGTGGGVPGVILKILRPDLSVVVCDSVGKKADAVQAIVSAISLDVEVFKGRGEERLEDNRFDAVVARAVGPLVKLIRMLDEHWLEAGRLLAIKGPKWVDERSAARTAGLLNSLELRKMAEYSMPGTGAISVILKIWPKGAPEK